MLAIEPGCRASCDEELRAIRILASIGHGEDTRSVLHIEVLVRKLLAINALAPRAIATLKVTPCGHR